MRARSIRAFGGLLNQAKVEGCNTNLSRPASNYGLLIFRSGAYFSCMLYLLLGLSRRGLRRPLCGKLRDIESRLVRCVVGLTES